MRQYYVYILANQTNRVLYTGITGNVDKRIMEHRGKVFEGFTKKYNVSKLVYIEQFFNPTDAIAAEKKIKGWTRVKKIQLIEAQNPEWEDRFYMFKLIRAPGVRAKDPSLQQK